MSTQGQSSEQPMPETQSEKSQQDETADGLDYFAHPQLMVEKLDPCFVQQPVLVAVVDWESSH